MATEKHSPKRRNLLAETRLLTEYLRDRYPGLEWRVKQRLGATRFSGDVAALDAEEVNLLRSYNRFADAVVITPAALIIIETAMWDAVNKVGQVRAYMKLVPVTPDLEPFRHLPIVGEVVTAQHDPLAEEIVKESGLRYVFYEPPWIDEYYALYPHRRRRAAFTGLPATPAEQPPAKQSTPPNTAPA